MLSRGAGACGPLIRANTSTTVRNRTLTTSAMIDTTNPAEERSWKNSVTTDRSTSSVARRSAARATSPPIIWRHRRRSRSDRDRLSRALANRRVARHRARARDLGEVWSDHIAEARLGARAARMERAARWEVEEARDLGSLQHHAPLRAGRRRISFGDGGDDRLGVRMCRVGHEGLARAELDDAPEVHDRDAPLAPEVPRDREIVGDEDD